MVESDLFTLTTFAEWLVLVHDLVAFAAHSSSPDRDMNSLARLHDYILLSRLPYTNAMQKLRRSAVLGVLEYYVIAH